MRRLAYVSAVAWAVELTLTLSSLITTPKDLEIAGVSVVGDLLLRTTVHCVWALIGILLSAASIFRTRNARWPLAFSAFWYLGFWYWNGSMRYLGPVAGYALKFRTAVQYRDLLSFGVRDVVLPIVFTILLVAAFRSRWKVD